VTRISNPKTAVVYASVFASLLPREVPLFAIVALPILSYLIETGWYAIVAASLSRASARAAYVASNAWVDRAAGGVMSVLGAKLIFDARQP
jgi:threonine/homoserine/homoserine lactone efflux protein